MSSSFGQIFGRLSYPKCLGISMLLGGLFYANIYDDGSKLQSQINEINGQIQAEEEKKKETEKVMAEEKAIKDEVGALAEQFKEVTERFPVNLKSDEIITTLNTLAKTTNVRIVSVKKENLDARELYEEVPVSIELVGTFNNLLLLMFNIASLEKVTNLGDFEMTNSTDRYDGKLKLITKVIGYKYRQSSEKTGSEGQIGVSGGTSVINPGGTR